MKKKSIFSVLLALIVLFLAACGGSQDKATEVDNSAESTETTETAESAGKSITVGCMSTYAPFAYVDENGNAAGYDVDVMKEAAKRAGYEIDFKPVEWAAIFTGLESGEWDVIANQMSRSPERETMYNMGNVPYYKNVYRLVVASDSNIESLEDLNGETLAQTTGDSATGMLEKYLEEKPGSFEIQYTEGTMAMILEDILNGKVVGNVNSPVTINLTAKENGIADKLKLVGEELLPSYVYTVFSNTEEGAKMRDDFDAALLEMINDGTLEKISNEYFEFNYNDTLKEGILK